MLSLFFVSPPTPFQGKIQSDFSEQSSCDNEHNNKVENTISQRIYREIATVIKKQQTKRKKQNNIKQFSYSHLFLCLKTQRSNKKFIGTAIAKTKTGANTFEIPKYKKRFRKDK